MQPVTRITFEKNLDKDQFEAACRAITMIKGVKHVISAPRKTVINYQKILDAVNELKTLAAETAEEEQICPVL